MLIKIKINKEKNLLYLLYVLNKSKFNDMKSKEILKKNFQGYGLSEEDCKILKELIRTEEKRFENEIKKHEHIFLAYSRNKRYFDEYWSKNLVYLEKIKDLLVKINEKFNYDILNEVAKFYDFKINESNEIEVLLFMGNINNIGRAFFNKTNIPIFIRNFNKPNIKDVEQDFRVIIHELIHLFDTNSRIVLKEDLVRYNIDIMDFFEEIARCFAPNGILFDKNDGNNLKLIEIIGEALNKNRKLVDIKDELIRQYKENQII